MGGESGTSVPAESLAPTISLGHDFSRSAKHGLPFLIMEEQSGKAGQPFFSPQPEPGQLRLWTYPAIALPEEMRATFRELEAFARDDLQAAYIADLAFCFDFSSDWALGIQPGQPKLKYIPECTSWYTAAGPHAVINIVDCTGDLGAYRAVLAPAMYVVSAAQAERIRTFGEGGGTFIAGVRLGVKTQQSQIVRTPLPGLLREVMYVEVLDHRPIYSEKQRCTFFRRSCRRPSKHGRGVSSGRTFLIRRVQRRRPPTPRAPMQARRLSQRTRGATGVPSTLERIFKTLIWPVILATLLGAAVVKRAFATPF